MKAEKLVFFRRQRPPRYEREIGDVFFILAAPHPAAAASGAIQRHLAQILLLGCAMAKPGVARPENRAQNAIACVRFASFQTAYARPKAVRAVGNGQRQGFRSGPLHCFGPFVGSPGCLTQPGKRSVRQFGSTLKIRQLTKTTRLSTVDTNGTTSIF